MPTPTPTLMTTVDETTGLATLTLDGLDKDTADKLAHALAGAEQADDAPAAPKGEAELSARMSAADLAVEAAHVRRERQLEEWVETGEVRS